MLCVCLCFIKEEKRNKSSKKRPSEVVIIPKILRRPNNPEPIDKRKARTASIVAV